MLTCKHVGGNFANLDLKHNARPSQSTTEDKVCASKAVDGNTNSHNDEVSCIKLQDDKNKPQPYWKVDFEHKLIQKIVVCNRKKDSDRQSNSEV